MEHEPAAAGCAKTMNNSASHIDGPIGWLNRQLRALGASAVAAAVGGFLAVIVTDPLIVAPVRDAAVGGWCGTTLFMAEAEAGCWIQLSFWLGAAIPVLVRYRVAQRRGTMPQATGRGSIRHGWHSWLLEPPKRRKKLGKDAAGREAANGPEHSPLVDQLAYGVFSWPFPPFRRFQERGVKPRTVPGIPATQAPCMDLRGADLQGVNLAGADSRAPTWKARPYGRRRPRRPMRASGRFPCWRGASPWRQWTPSGASLARRACQSGSPCEPGGCSATSPSPCSSHPGAGWSDCGGAARLLCWRARTSGERTSRPRTSPARA